MKKIFTLVAMAFMAVCASAQGTYYVSTEVTYEDGMEIKDISNVVATLGTDLSGTKEVTGKFDDANFKVRLTGKVNPDANPPKNDQTEPTSGMFVEFQPKVAGSITVAYKLGGNKTQYFVEDGVVIKEVPETTGSSAYNLTEFPVKAGSTYYVYTGGSKMEFFGFIYKADVTGIKGVTTQKLTADSPFFNLAGQRVAKGTKGVVIQNGKKYVNK